MRFNIKIKEFAFGDDYAHVHMEINVPRNLSMQQVEQILKSHSASKVFKEMPNYIKRYPDKHFWGCKSSGTSVGPVGESIIKNYIRRQDVSYEPFLPGNDKGKQMKLQFN